MVGKTLITRWGDASARGILSADVDGDVRGRWWLLFFPGLGLVGSFDWFFHDYTHSPFHLVRRPQMGGFSSLGVLENVASVLSIFWSDMRGDLLSGGFCS